MVSLPLVRIPLTFLSPVLAASAVKLKLILMLMPLTTMEVTMAIPMVMDMVCTTPELLHTLEPLLHTPTEAHKVSVVIIGADKWTEAAITANLRALKSVRLHQIMSQKTF